MNAPHVHVHLSFFRILNLLDRIIAPEIGRSSKNVDFIKEKIYYSENIWADIVGISATWGFILSMIMLLCIKEVLRGR